jgi:hypothetical protein
MKKNFTLFIFLCIFAISHAQQNTIDFRNGNISSVAFRPPVRTVTSNNTDVIVDYTFSGAKIQFINHGADAYNLYEIPGFSFMDSLGKPAVPATNDLFAVPYKTGLKIVILEANYSEYNCPIAIYPALEKELDSGPPSQFVKDVLTYSKNEFYPNNIVEIASIQDYRGVPLAFIELRPIQFNPKTSRIRFYTKIRYKIVYENITNMKVDNLPSKTTNFLKNVITNPNSIFQTTTNLSSDSYLIVTTNTYLEAAKEFAKWKTLLGNKCKIFSNASWTSGSVKDSVHAAYANLNPKPEYLLIIGDHGDVPGETYYSSYGNYATDLHYACMGGANDFIADLAFGRISVNSLEQAYTVLRKIINYEKNPVTDPSFYSKGLHCAEFQDRQSSQDPDGYEDRRFVLTSEEIRDYLISKGKVINRVYYTTSSVTPRYYNKNRYSDGHAIPGELRKDISPYFPWNGSSNDIVNEINDGRFYLLHRDHGSYSGWGAPSFNTSHIPNLTNSNKLPVVFSLNCQTGGFLQTECFAEKFLRHPSGGAVGVFAASQVSYSGYNDALAVGMFDAIWSNPGLLPDFGQGTNSYNVTSHSDIYPMGKVLIHGLIRMGETYGLDSYTNRIFHYFGDPSMEIYTDNPASFSNIIVTQSNNNDIFVNTSVPNCKIIVSSSSDMGKSYFQAIDSVSSYTFNNVNVPVFITIKKHNYVPLTLSSIIGKNEITCEETTFSVNDSLPNAIYNWTTSPNIEIVSGQAASTVQVKGKSYNAANSWVRLTVTYNGQTYVKERPVAVNIPNQFVLTPDDWFTELPDGRIRTVIRAKPFPEGVKAGSCDYQWSATGGTVSTGFDLADPLDSALVYEGNIPSRVLEMMNEAILQAKSEVSGVVEGDSVQVKQYASAGTDQSSSLAAVYEVTTTTSEGETRAEYVSVETDGTVVTSVNSTIAREFDVGVTFPVLATWSFATLTFTPGTTVTVSCNITGCNKSYSATLTIMSWNYTCSYTPSTRSIRLDKNRSSSGGSVTHTYRVQLYNDRGYIRTTTFTSNETTVLIPLTGLPDGNYYINVLDEENRIVERKFILAY